MTTILGVRRGNEACLGGDGQVSFGDVAMKGTATKVRRLRDASVLAGFAGSAADAFTLFEKFEKHLDARSGNLSRAVVDMAQEWRSDRMLRRLEALLIVMDKKHSFLLSGSGDVIEPDDGILAIGSGGNYAAAAARALLRHSDLGAREICERSLGIAAELCVYTNDHLTVLELGAIGP